MHGCNQHIVVVLSGIIEVSWLFCGIYMSTDYRLQRVLWEDQSSGQVDQGFLSLIAGDLNYMDDP